MTTTVQPRLIVVLLVLCCGCTSLGRRVNQSLPEFMRGDPGLGGEGTDPAPPAAARGPAGRFGAPDGGVRAARRAYDCQNYDTAASLFEDFIDEYPASEYDEEARFLWGESQFHGNDYVGAFDAYKQYAEAYPVSNRAPCIQERVYVMACAYLSGRRRTFLGLFTAKGVGEDMDIWLVHTYPNAARAADAQWALGRYYVCDAEWAKAAAAFDFLVKQYPNSEWFPAARYFAAYTRYRQVKGTCYDPAIVREARSRFESYVHDFPTGQWRASAEHLICILDNIAAQKILNVAQWYVDQGKCWSARYYLERLEALYPASNAAVCGRRLYATLPSNPPCPARSRGRGRPLRRRRIAPEPAESRPESSRPKAGREDQPAAPCASADRRSRRRRPCSLPVAAIRRAPSCRGRADDLGSDRQERDLLPRRRVRLHAVPDGEPHPEHPRRRAGPPLRRRGTCARRLSHHAPASARPGGGRHRPRGGTGRRRRGVPHATAGSGRILTSFTLERRSEAYFVRGENLDTERAKLMRELAHDTVVRLEGQSLLETRGYPYGATPTGAAPTTRKSK